MSTFSYKSGGRTSRYLSDYRDQTVGSLNVSYTLEDWWEDLDQTITIAETSVVSNNYGKISQYGSYGIACRVKGSGASNNNQVANGTILIVGGRKPLKFSGSARAFPINVPYTNINCTGGVCIYSYESGVVSDTVGLHGPSTVLDLGKRTIGSFITVRDHQKLFRFTNADESRTYVYNGNIVDEFLTEDYGLIIQQYTNQTCTNVQGVISNTPPGNTTAASGCTKVAPGTTLTIAPANTYTVPSQVAQPTTSLDYGNITDLDQVTRYDYGYIWRLRTERPYGFVKKVGEAQAKATNAWVGEGRLTIFNEQRQIKFYGYIVDGKVRCFGTADANYSPAPKGRGIIPLSGNVLESFEPAPIRAGGTLFAFSGAAESATFNPDEKQMLFSFTGVSHCSNTDAFSGSGSLFALSGLSESITNIQIGSGLWRFNGDSHETRSRTFIGSGSLKKFSGLAESLTFNPEEKQLLFSFTGSGTEKNTESYVGSGNLFAFSGAAESITNIQIGGGLWKFSGDSHHTRSRTFVGSGSLKKFSGAAESLTFNPDERQLLFSILGVGTEKHTEVYVGSGNLFAFSGLSESVSVTEKATGTEVLKLRSFTHASNTDNYVGFGSLKKFSGFAESITFNPLERQLLFSFTGGITSEKHTESYVGSGRIKKLSGAAESIRWSAQHTTGLYKITGDSHDARARDFVGSGSLKKFSGAAESLTFNPLERDMLFSFTGGITSEKHTESYVGSGFLRNFATIGIRNTFDYVGSGSIKLLPRKPEIYELSQLGHFTLDYYTLQREYIDLGYLEFYNQANTNLGSVKLKFLSYEFSHEKHTEAYNNSACVDGEELDYGFIINQGTNLNCTNVSGTINSNTTAATGCSKVAPGTTLAIAPPNTYTIPTAITTPTSSKDYGLVSDPNFNEREDYGHILDSLSKVCPYGAFEVTGTASTFYVENIVSTGISVSGRATVNIFGEGDTFWTPPYFGSGFTRILGSLANESFTPAPHIGEGTLFAFSGAAESTSIGAVSGGLFKLSGDGYTLFSLQHFGSGVIRISGDATESTTTPFTGSGSLKKFSGAAESATFNPLERQMLFSFTGVGGEVFVANPPEEGAEIRLSGTTSPEILTFAEQPFGRIPISGVGGTDRTRAFVGSGSLKKFSGAAESITFNPEEKQLLFSFTGSGTERITANPPEEGTQIRISGEAIQRVRVHEDVFGRIPITGIADTDRTRSYVGSGSLKKFSGAAESITVNPLERQLLFSFTGIGSENTSVVEIASGRLFTFSSSTVVSAVAYETTGLFKLSGDAGVVRVPSYKGSGSLKKFSGAAESLTVNPDERQLLFSFVGERIAESKSTTETASGNIKIYPEASDIRFIPNWNSVGGLKLYIESSHRIASDYVGSGSLKKFSGAAESITINPTEEQMLFSFTGQGSESRLAREISKGGTLKLSGVAIDKLVPNNIGSGIIFVTGDANTVRARDFAGSGSIRKLSGAAESRVIDITTLPSLFRVYGDGDIARSRPYIGSGSLKKFSGAAESLTFNPDEKQMLFSFLGQATTTRARDKVGQGTVKTLGDSIARFSPVHIGSGTTRLSGNATVVRARDFVGFGSLRKLSGAAEALTFNPLEKQMLFSFTGVGADSRTSKLLSQGGTLAVRGTSGDPLLTFAEQPRVEIDITGDSIDLRVHAYQGSGRISNVNNADDAYVRAPYIGSGNVTISGIALVQVQLFQPPFTQVWII